MIGGFEVSSFVGGGKTAVVYGVFRVIVEFVRSFVEIEDELVTGICFRCRVVFEETFADGLRL